MTLFYLIINMKPIDYVYRYAGIYEFEAVILWNRLHISLW